MRKRAKPRENWESVVSVSRQDFPSKDYEEILRGLNIPFTDQTIKEIIEAQIAYYATIRNINQKPTMSEICATMKRLIKYGRKYQECLEKMDDESRLKMALVMPTQFELWGILDRNLEDTIFVTCRAEDVLERWEISKKTRTDGRPFNLPIRTYISNLAKIFQEPTGKRATVSRDPKFDKELFELYGDKKYKGKFFDFVSLCIKKIPQHPILKNTTLGSIIEETLRRPIISHIA